MADRQGLSCMGPIRRAADRQTLLSWSVRDAEKTVQSFAISRKAWRSPWWHLLYSGNGRGACIPLALERVQIFTNLGLSLEERVK